MNQMKQFYLEKVVPALQAKFAYKNVMEIPRLQKIVVNMGVGAAAQNRKILDEAAETLTAITGQKAVVTTAKKAIANFHLREGLGIGAKVTLHGDMMWDFLYRFININLPRGKDSLLKRMFKEERLLFDPVRIVFKKFLPIRLTAHSSKRIGHLIMMA